MQCKVGTRCDHLGIGHFRTTRRTPPKYQSTRQHHSLCLASSSRLGLISSASPLLPSFPLHPRHRQIVAALNYIALGSLSLSAVMQIRIAPRGQSLSLALPTASRCSGSFRDLTTGYDEHIL